MGIFFHSEVNGIISWVSGGEELKHLLGLLPTPSQSRIGLADCFWGGSLKVIIGPPKNYLYTKNAASQRHRDFQWFCRQTGYMLKAFSGCSFKTWLVHRFHQASPPAVPAFLQFNHPVVPKAFVVDKTSAIPLLPVVFNLHLQRGRVDFDIWSKAFGGLSGASEHIQLHCWQNDAVAHHCTKEAVAQSGARTAAGWVEAKRDRYFIPQKKREALVPEGPLLWLNLEDWWHSIHWNLMRSPNKSKYVQISRYVVIFVCLRCKVWLLPYTGGPLGGAVGWSWHPKRDWASVGS